MPSFDEVSFLSDELWQWIGAARERYANLFEYADRVNGVGDAMAARGQRNDPL
ncbi:hypothetical protein [Burkholderia ubonensis]|uniref:hypothetical protein n=1 Tax=Burkholderia ubonensis TaxID=101571 RepID=UPI000B2214D1|nr:hypothetical protein [Burkholderia ubonensis]